MNRGAQAKVMMADGRRDSPLHLASYCFLDSASDLRVGTGILHLLVQAGASLSARNHDHLTVFESAVVYPTYCPTSGTYFLDLGLSPNTKESTGCSLLSNTVMCDETAFRVMEVLLNRGQTLRRLNCGIYSMTQRTRARTRSYSIRYSTFYLFTERDSPTTAALLSALAMLRCSGCSR